MEKKISISIALIISISLLGVLPISGALTELVYPPVPEPKLPYTVSDLKAITQVFLWVEETIAPGQPKLPEYALDIVFGEIAPRIKTFTGEKYAEFEPRLTCGSCGIAYPKEGFKWDFRFYGDGYVDPNNGQSDYYSFQIIFFNWDNMTEVYEYPVWGGVPEEYRSMAEGIALENSEVQELRKTAPYVGEVFWWNPEKYAHIWMAFGSQPPPGYIIEPIPKAYVVEVDLENQKVVSISIGIPPRIEPGQIEPEPTQIRWPLIAGIIGAIVIIGIVAALYRRRRRPTEFQ